MGEGFLEAIDAPLSMKSYLESESRLENGKRMITDHVKIDSRELTLSFTIKGTSQSDYQARKKAFCDEVLYKGRVTVEIPALGADVYHLVYLGKSVSYGQNVHRTFGTISGKFCEPNPANRV